MNVSSEFSVSDVVFTGLFAAVAINGANGRQHRFIYHSQTLDIESVIQSTDLATILSITSSPLQEVFPADTQDHLPPDGN